MPSRAASGAGTAEVTRALTSAGADIMNRLAGGHIEGRPVEMGQRLWFQRVHTDQELL